MTDITHTQHSIDTPAGTLHAESWLPVNAQGVPIVLLHDSLGCVALWRDFPAQLAQATGHRVIAYDRLGFGRSAAHPGQLRRGFVEAEAHEGFASCAGNWPSMTSSSLATASAVAWRSAARQPSPSIAGGW